MAFSLTIPERRQLTGGDILAQSLKQMGVTVAFGVHGGHLDAFLVGCEDIGMKLVDTRHETVAVQAAEAYSKVTGTVGACFVTANSGFSNGLPGLATAFADRSPVFCITSSVPLRDQENNSLQGQIDQVLVATPLTKFSHRVTYAEDIPRIVAHGMHMAVSGAPGPVLLDFPIDVLFSPISPSRISWGSISSAISYLPGPHKDAITKAAALLKQAERPAIIIGTGARSPEAAKSLLTFTESTHIPLFHSTKFCILTSLYSSPLFAGSADGLGLLPNIGSAPPDCILLLGSRTGMYLGGQSGAIIPTKDCKIIHVDTDGGELGRTIPVDVGIVSDVAQALEALTSQVSHDPVRAPEEWVKVAVGLKDITSPFDKDSTVMEDGRIHPHHAMSRLFSSLPEGPMVVLDGGECSFWAGGVANRSRPHSVMTATGYLGFLGTGFGAALGCAVAHPDRLVVNIQGDGSAGFHFMDLDSYARHGLRILTIVVNNSCWGMSANGQELVYGSKTSARPVSSLSSETDYALIARGLANPSARVDRIEQLESAVKRLLDTKGPSCIDLRVSNRPIHPVTAAFVKPTDDPDVIVVPYYSNLPRPYYMNSSLE